MNKFLMSAAAFCALLAAPSIADAAAVRGFATANVNMRSGPSTSYPAVAVIPVGAPVTIYGCMSSVNWCDVTFVGGRGWVSGSYVQASYRSNRVYVAPDYYQGLGIPTVTFEVDNYWDRYYRDRNFYRERDRWRRYDWRSERPLPPPRWDRDDRRPPPRWDHDDRRPLPPRWDNDDRRPPPPRWDNDDRRPPPRWDNGDRRPPPPQWDRDRDRNRDQDRDGGRPPRMDDGNRQPQPGRDAGRPGRDERPQRPQDGRDQNREDGQRREWGGMRPQDNGQVCTGPARDCR